MIFKYTFSPFNFVSKISGNRQVSKKKTAAQKKQRIVDQKQTEERKRFALQLQTKHIIGIFLLVCILFFSKIVFGLGNFWEDLIELEFPHRIFARDCLTRFQFPFWNPFTFTGMPFFASLNTGVLYPFNLLLSFIPAGYQTFWYLLQLDIVFHYFIAGCAMYFFLVKTGSSKVASFFGGIGYMFCGFLVTHVVHSMMLNILVWVPFVMLFLTKAIRRGTVHDAVIAGLIGGLSTLGGHPQITFYELLFLSWYLLYLLVDCAPAMKDIGIHGYLKPRLRGFVNTGIFLGIMLGISLVMFLPAIEMSAQSSRVSWTFDLVSEGSIGIVQMVITALMPKFFGAWTGYDSTAPYFWLKGPHFGYYTYWDTCFYTGIAILFLAILQLRDLRRDRFTRFALLWLVFSFFVALGSHSGFFRFLFEMVPGFGKFRAPGRMTFTWNLLLPVMAARFLDTLRNREQIGRFRLPGVILLSLIALAGGVAAAGLLGNFWPEPFSDSHIAAFSSLQGLILLGNCLILGLLWYLYCFSGTIGAGTFGIGCVAALIVDLFIFGVNHHVTNRSGAPSHFQSNVGIIESIRKENESELFRFNTRQFVLDDESVIVRQSDFMLFPKNQGLVGRIQTTEGFNPLNLYRRIPPSKGRRQFQRFLDLLNIKYYVDPDLDRTSNDVVRVNGSRMARAEMFYDYKIFPGDSAVKEYMLANDFDYRSVLLLTKKPELSIVPSLSGDSARGTVVITKYSNSEIEIDVTTPRNGLLWLSEIWYPAWNASVDGNPTEILCADYCFRAIAVPAGNHHIVVRYSSGLFLLGGMVSGAVFLAALGYLILVVCRLKKGKRRIP